MFLHACRVAYHKGGRLVEGTIEAIDEKHGKVRASGCALMLQAQRLGILPARLIFSCKLSCISSRASLVTAQSISSVGIEFPIVCV